MTPGSRRIACAAVLALGAGAGGAAAQDAQAVAEACIGRGGVPAVCASAAVAARAVLGHLGVAAGLGSEVAGTASNLGQRLGTSPRLAFAARLGAIRAGMPDLGDGTGQAETTFTLPVVHADATVGLFDGFRVMPTVGGLLALDLFARAGFVLLPSGEGFDGAAGTYAIGARVGVFRESFTMPGVSVSVAKRFSGEVRLGDTASPFAGEVALDPSITSLRATVGKDLFAVEVLAGMGFDDYSADVSYGVGSGVGGVVTGTGSLEGTRRLYFLGASRSFNIVFLLSLEAGVAHGFDPIPAYTGRYDSAGSSFFGSVAFRLTI